MGKHDLGSYEFLRGWEADIYLAHYRPGCLKSPPWGDELCDCFVILGESAVDHELARCLALDMASLRNDWVEVFGTNSETLHDMVDEASVSIGRQQAVGDGFPMTAWHTAMLDFDEIASHLSVGGLGAAPVAVVVFVGQDDAAIEQLKAKLAQHISQLEDAE